MNREKGSLMLEVVIWIVPVTFLFLFLIHIMITYAVIWEIRTHSPYENQLKILAKPIILELAENTKQNIFSQFKLDNLELQTNAQMLIENVTYPQRCNLRIYWKICIFSLESPFTEVQNLPVVCTNEAK